MPSTCRRDPCCPVPLEQRSSWPGARRGAMRRATRHWQLGPPQCSQGVGATRGLARQSPTKPRAAPRSRPRARHSPVQPAERAKAQAMAFRYSAVPPCCRCRDGPCRGTAAEAQSRRRESSWPVRHDLYSSVAVIQRTTDTRDRGWEGIRMVVITWSRRNTFAMGHHGSRKAGLHHPARQDWDGAQSGPQRGAESRERRHASSSCQGHDQIPIAPHHRDSPTRLPVPVAPCSCFHFTRRSHSSTASAARRRPRSQSVN